MKYRLLGDTGLYVSELCLGTMTFGGDGFWKVIGGLPQEGADRLVGMALDSGINFFDTANIYAYGESEKQLGKALGSRRQDVVIATKVFCRMGRGCNQVGLSRSHIMDQVEASLQRLGTDYIDLYQIHNFDPLTPMEDTLRTLDDLVRSGKVRFLGCSNLAAWQIMKALGISRYHGWDRFRSVQSYYSLVGRELERELIPMVRDQKLGLMIWSPLAGGFLSGKFSRDNQAGAGRRAEFDYPPVDKERGYQVIDLLQDIAQHRQVSVPRLALAWLLHQKGVTSVIVGAKREDQLTDNLGAVDISFSADELERLDHASRLSREYPGWLEDMPIDRHPGEGNF